MEIAKRNILITGAAKGMGRLYAIKALEEGACVVLWDIDELALKETTSELKSFGGILKSYVVDISSTTSINQAAEKVKAEIGSIDILFNNAGCVIGKPFINHTDTDIESTIAVNTMAPMYITKCFINDMIHKGQARIVNISSAAGLTPNPNMSVYAASKWAMIGWSESLRLEMESNKFDVKVTTVTSSYVNTGMFDGVKAPLLCPIINPEKLVNMVWHGMKQGKVYVRAPWIVSFLPFLRGVMPARIFDLICGKLFRIYTSMDTFKGR